MARGKKKESALTPEEKLEWALVPENEWPYQVPENWCWTRLAHIARWGSGGTPSRKKPAYYEGTTPWIKTGELNDDYIYETEEHISEDAIANSSAKLFPVNTIAIAMYGATIGKVGILGIEATTNQACACAVASAAVDYKYLFRFAQSQKDTFIMKGKGGAQPNISQEIIKEHEFPLPPLAEQQRIVDRIESLFAKLDEAKEKAQIVLDSFETRKAAILHKAFTGELTAKWRSVHGSTLSTWQELLLKDVGTWGSGGTPSRNKPEYFVGDVPWVKTGELNNGYIYQTEEAISEDAISNSSAKKYPAGTVLIAMYGATIGKCAILGIEATTNQACACAVPNSDTCNRFLFYYLLSQKDEFIKLGKGGAQPNISQSVIKQYPIRLPPFDEQTEIVRILDSLFSKEQQAKETAEAVLEQIDLLKKSILARAFRGELGTNDPSEESAVELLKQVL